jgi:hypothetical protein
MNYRANTASIRDMRFQQRDKYYGAATAAILAGNTPSQERGAAASANPKRPQSANASAQGIYTGKAPSAAEIGLRMVNWKYGSMVRVEDSPPRKAHHPVDGGGVGQRVENRRDSASGLHDIADRSDDEFVAGALMNRRGNNSESVSERRDSALSANWHHVSVSASVQNGIDKSSDNLVDVLRLGMKTETESLERGAMQKSIKAPISKQIKKQPLQRSVSATLAAPLGKAAEATSALESSLGRLPQQHFLHSPQGLSISGDRPAAKIVKRYAGN